MKSLIIREASRFLITILALYSAFLFLRGHDHPGGGFIAGLVAASAWALIGIATEPKEIRKVLPFSPQKIRAFGLLLMIGSGSYALFFSDAFLTGHWTSIAAGKTGSIHFGTPLVFDLGVYLLVFGALLDVLRIFEERH